MVAERTSTTPFRLFVESVQDYAIFMLDPDGYVVSWNPGVQRINGYEADEILGQHFSIFYTAEDRQRGHPEEELEIARQEGRYAEEGLRRRKDGSTFHSHVVITAVRDEDGELLGFGKVTRDLTDRVRQEERERELHRERTARAEAEAANQAKAQFLTTMSHELRTPLNAIIGYVDLLALGVQGTLNPTQVASLARVRTSAELLLAMINDVLSFARIEAGRVQLAIAPTSVQTAITGVVSIVASQIEGKEILLERRDCAADVVVLADPDRLQQILVNLIVNAIKFTAPGGRIELDCAAGADQVRISVRDTGRGIAPDKLASIFEPFIQIDRHLTATSTQGVGLGLAISRDLAYAMNGTIEVESELGVGSTFTVVLPRVASS